MGKEDFCVTKVLSLGRIVESLLTIFENTPSSNVISESSSESTSTINFHPAYFTFEYAL